MYLLKLVVKETLVNSSVGAKLLYFLYLCRIDGEQNLLGVANQNQVDPSSNTAKPLHREMREHPCVPKAVGAVHQCQCNPGS